MIIEFIFYVFISSQKTDFQQKEQNKVISGSLTITTSM